MAATPRDQDRAVAVSGHDNLAQPPGGRDPTRRRRDAAVAGHAGDQEAARAALVDPDGRVRATALGALCRMGSLTAADLAAGLTDPDPGVRRRAAELAGRSGAEMAGPAGAGAPPGGEDRAADVPAGLSAQLAAALLDREPAVVEAVAWALGELGDPATVTALASVAGDHPDPLCREAAVAALGAVGDPSGLEAILAAMADRPAVRRRAVIALAPFEGPEVEDAVRRATGDRDWQVRQAAEDLLGDAGD
ncbi:MAG: HEAT repeat domain-containing protein [Acidimicrobiales bacterium]